MRAGKLGLILVVGTLCAGPAALAAEYELDTRQSLLTVKTQKDGPAARLAHDHVIQATDFSGTVTFDPGAAEGHSVAIEAKTASLRVDETAMRKKMGLDGELGEGDRKDIAGNMMGEDQLFVSKYPTIAFKSTSIKKQADGTYLVNGKLTVRGKTNDVSFPAKVDVTGEKLHAVGTLKFTHTQFGFKPYSAMFGAVKNKDDLEMRVELYATAKAAPAPAAAASSSGPAPSSSGMAPASSSAPAKK